MNRFVYLGSMFTRDGKIDADVEKRVNAENKVNSSIHAVVTNKSMSKKPEWLFTMSCCYLCFCMEVNVGCGK